MSTESPKRRVTISIDVGGDTMGDAVSMLQHFMRMIEDGSPTCVTGGYDRCGTFTVIERPDVTHETFLDALDKWMEQQESTGGPHARE